MCGPISRFPRRERIGSIPVGFAISRSMHFWKHPISTMVLTPRGSNQLYVVTFLIGSSRMHLISVRACVRETGLDEAPTSFFACWSRSQIFAAYPIRSRCLAASRPKPLACSITATTTTTRSESLPRRMPRPEDIGIHELKGKIHSRANSVVATLVDVDLRKETDSLGAGRRGRESGRARVWNPNHHGKGHLYDRRGNRAGEKGLRLSRRDNAPQRRKAPVEVCDELQRPSSRQRRGKLFLVASR